MRKGTLQSQNPEHFLHGPVFWNSIASYTEFPLMHRCAHLTCIKNERMHSFLAVCSWHMGRKLLKSLVNGPRIPEKQKQPWSLWKKESQGPLTIKTSGSSSENPRSMLVDMVVTDICKSQEPISYMLTHILSCQSCWELCIIYTFT